MSEDSLTIKYSESGLCKMGGRCNSSFKLSNLGPGIRFQFSSSLQGKFC